MLQADYVAWVGQPSGFDGLSVPKSNVKNAYHTQARRLCLVRGIPGNGGSLYRSQPRPSAWRLALRFQQLVNPLPADPKLLRDPGQGETAFAHVLGGDDVSGG